MSTITVINSWNIKLFHISWGIQRLKNIN